MSCKMPLLTVAVLLSAPGCIASAADRGDEDSARTDHELTGGTVATAQQWKSVVRLTNCTASKVGPRHFLTAAHCVVKLNTHELASGRRPGDILEIWDHADRGFPLRGGAGAPVLVEIVETHVHPTYLELNGVPDDVGNRYTASDLPDMAIIEVSDATPAIPESEIDTRPQGEGQLVTIIEGTDVDVTMSGGEGDADLYVALGAAPTTQSYDCRPKLAGNEESCRVSGTGTFHVLVRGYNRFEDVSVSATVASCE